MSCVPIPAERVDARVSSWRAVKDTKLKDAVQTNGDKNRMKFSRWFQVEHKSSVVTEGNSCGVVPNEIEIAVEIILPLRGDGMT
jgi:hypothetical protein